ncbi:MAG TPA: hypothetical protein VJ802_08875 [Gemmatimonadaceae bacterium]|nr:hypothetical protein [Gemmatimonadaceae bacterium]
MRRSLVLAASIVTLAGCTSFRLVQPNEPVPTHATVAITFNEPRDLEARREATVYPLPQVGTVYGEVEATRSDTLVLRVLSIESSRRQPRLPEQARLTLVPDASAQLSMSRISKARTASMVGVTAVGLFFLFVSQMEW